MDTNGMRRRVPHGVAGLLVVLFSLAGLAFSYGLSHPPPFKTCPAHNLGAAPADTAAPSASEGAQAPVNLPQPAPQDLCLSLAVLLTLVVLGLAAGPRRWGAVRSRRFGWSLSPPVSWSPPPRSRAALQVLRL